MIIKCPACGAEYECDPGKYQCACGAKFCVAEDGKVYLIPVALPLEEDTANNRTSYYINGVKLEMVFCPAGSFTMGSPANEKGRHDEEIQHRVTLTKPFWIGKYEVTQKQYQAVMGPNPSKFKGDDLPVEKVNWNEAMMFCDELNALTEGNRPAGYKFSLPTEAQWEYACRAGTTTGLNNGRDLRQPDGEDIALNKVGWYGENSGAETHPVGQKQPNAWGIYDMHGNVWEWCLDWCDIYSGDAVDPAGPSSPSIIDTLFHVRGLWRYRVFRGGSWNSFAKYCRSASRCSSSPGSRLSLLGFRVALVPVQ